MESFFGRYKNPLVLMAALLIQVIVLATQVKRPSDPKVPHSPETRLIRMWAVTSFTPIERLFVGTSHFFRSGWHNYVDLRGVRRHNQDLQAENTRLRMEQVRLKEDAEQAHRLQALLGFREKTVAQTVAAQVIGTSGSEQSRVIYIDKDAHDGIKTDMAVITPDGIVGKVKDVFPLSSQVLLINDPDSGAGVILEKSRLQGVLRGTSLGELQVEGVMADQVVEPGEQVIASGGDRIYPKGMPVGTVVSAAPDHETGNFLVIKVKPAADLNRLEEVLVVTKMTDQVPSVADGTTPVRAADILAQRLPRVPKTVQPQAGPPSIGGAVGTDDKKNLKPATTPKNPAAGSATPPGANGGTAGTDDKKKLTPKNPAAGSATPPGANGGTVKVKPKQPPAESADQPTPTPDTAPSDKPQTKEPAPPQPPSTKPENPPQ